MLRALLAKLARPKAVDVEVQAVDVDARVADLRAYLKTVPRDDLGNLIYPDDVDAVAVWFPALAEVCRLTGQPLPKWPTRRSLDEEIARCAAALMPTVVKPPLRELAADVAARTFVAWLVANGRTGEFDSESLSRAYREHCQQARLMPCSDQTLRKHLVDVDGVSKGIVEAGKVGNRRERNTKWVVRRPSPIKQKAADARLAA